MHVEMGRLVEFSRWKEESERDIITTFFYKGSGVERGGKEKASMMTFVYRG